MSDAAEILGEALDYFSSNDTDPGGEWAFCDDRSELGLDFRGKDGTKFWLDIKRDGTISIYWRPAGMRGRTIEFATHIKSEPK